MGADVALDRDGLTVTGSGRHRAASTSTCTTRRAHPGRRRALRARRPRPRSIRGVAHIRGHETDRLAALATELDGLGAEVAETDDGLRICPKPLHGGRFRTYARPPDGDGGALVWGCASPGVVVEDVATTAKTLPDFTAPVVSDARAPGD